MRIDKRKGFTLIELLVVIAIIAVLAAILFPVFAKARETAKRTACIAQLKEIGYAARMYGDDFSGSYVLALKYGTNAPSGWSFWDWGRLMLPYLKSYKMLNCPGAANPTKLPLAANRPEVRFGYGYNEYIFHSGPNVWPQYSRFSKESGITSPKYTFLIGDVYDNALINDWTDDWKDPDPEDPTLKSGFIRCKYAEGEYGGKYTLRHGGSNVLFCDLHVKNLKNYQFHYQDSPLKEFPIVYPDAKPYL